MFAKIGVRIYPRDVRGIIKETSDNDKSSRRNPKCTASKAVPNKMAGDVMVVLRSCPIAVNEKNAWKACECSKPFRMRTNPIASETSPRQVRIIPRSFYVFWGWMDGFPLVRSRYNSLNPIVGLGQASLSICFLPDYSLVL